MGLGALYISFIVSYKNGAVAKYLRWSHHLYRMQEYDLLRSSVNARTPFSFPGRSIKLRNPGVFSLLCTSQQKLDTNFTFFFSKYPTTVQCYASFVSLLVADWIVSGASRLSSLLVYCLCGFGLDNRSSSDIIEARRPSGINLY